MNYTREHTVSRVLARLTWCILILSAAGCAMVGQNYTRPDIAMNESWNTRLTAPADDNEADPQELAVWWKSLEDPELTGLIERACSNNLDLKAAQSRLREARASRITARAGLLPSLDLSGSATRSRSSKDTGGGSAATMYSTGLDAGWEMDFFGGVRRSVEAAEADIEAAREELNDVLVSLSAEVAVNYIDLRTYQARLDVANENLRAQQETYELTRSRFLTGLDDELAVTQARANLENTRAQIPSLEASIDAAKNRIAVLLGESAGSVHEELGDHRPIPAASPAVAQGVPADVLRRRPDVRQAERELAAQSARVGVAQSELYPKLTLNGSIGFDARSAGDLLTAGSRAWSYGPRLTLPIFNAGSIRAGIEIASALQEQALINYEATVLAAVEEVENALVAYVQEQSRQQSLNQAAMAAQQSVDFAENKYQAGLVDFDTVLDAQRSLLSYQDQLAVSEGTVTTNLVRLYKALGGGWTPVTPDTETQTPTQGETR